MPLRVATWNVNSVRLRLPLVQKLIGEAKIDILCLQETKAQQTDFPFDGLKALGFEHIHAHGSDALVRQGRLPPHHRRARRRHRDS
jgi:exodeoxyribonuclease-3